MQIHANLKKALKWAQEKRRRTGQMFWIGKATPVQKIKECPQCLIWWSGMSLQQAEILYYPRGGKLNEINPVREGWDGEYHEWKVPGEIRKTRWGALVTISIDPEGSFRGMTIDVWGRPPNNWQKYPMVRGTIRGEGHKGGGND